MIVHPFLILLADLAILAVVGYVVLALVRVFRRF